MSDTEQSLHDRLRAKDRKEWIDDDGQDTLPVFVTKSGRKYHRRYDGCIEERFASVHYDLFAAEMDGYDPCLDCFEDDRYVDTESNQ